MERIQASPPYGCPRDRELLHEGREVAIALGPQRHVPMIGHQAIGHNPHRPAFERFSSFCSNASKSAAFRNSRILPTPRFKASQQHPARSSGVRFSA